MKKIILLLLLSPMHVFAGASPFLNLQERISELNLVPYLSTPSVRPITIAIFDLDFTGWDAEKGKSLSADIEYRPGPHPSDLPPTGHGLEMAQIAWAAVSNGGAQKRPVHFILYQTAGYSQLKWAVNDAIAANADVVLYAQVWEFGSNFDGKGFLNALVDRAIDSGITWVNAAGNYGRLTFNAHVVEGSDDGGKAGGGTIPNVAITCKPISHQDGPPEKRVTVKAADSCALRMVLSWNDFSEDSEAATDKDLDLDLVDLSGNIVSSSHLRQVGAPQAGEKKSKYAREMIEMSVQPGRYFAQVTVHSDNFTSADKFRIVVSGNDVAMPDATVDDSILPPADNKNAITVSAGDSEIASWSSEAGKPDFWTQSEIITNSHIQFLGSSNSAALTAGTIALLKSVWPEAALTSAGITVRDLKLSDWKSLVDLNSVGRFSGTGMNAESLGVLPLRGGTCFSPRVAVKDGHWLPGATVVDGSQQVRAWQTLGAVWVDSTQGPKLMIAHDPSLEFPGIGVGSGARSSASSGAVASAGAGLSAVMVDARGRLGASLVARSQVVDAQAKGWAEILQLPRGYTICGHEMTVFRASEVVHVRDGLKTPFFRLPAYSSFQAWLN